MDSVDCAVCMTSYDTKAHRPVLGTCGHSLCLSCLKPIQQTSRGSCPICVRLNAFNETKFNFQMIELIEVTEQKKRSELREATNQAKTVKELERVKAELKKTRENTAKRNKSATPKLVAIKNPQKTEQKTGNSADANSFLYEPTTRKEPIASSRKKSNNSVVTTKVFVNNLDLDITNNILYNLFVRYGKVTSYEVLRRQDGKSKGCGFVCFSTNHDAVNAMTKLDSYMLGSKRIRISLTEEKETAAKKDQQRVTNLCVKNLDANINDEDLRTIFEVSGVITSATVITKPNGESKCFGFVEFENSDDALNAMAQTNSKMIISKRIHVSAASERETSSTSLAVQRPATSARLPVQSVQVSRLSPVSPLNSARGPTNSTKVPLNSASEPSNSTTGPLNHVRESSNLTRRAFNSDRMPLNSVREPFIPAREQMDTTRSQWIPDRAELYPVPARVVRMPSIEESESDSFPITPLIVIPVTCLVYYFWKRV